MTKKLNKDQIKNLLPHREPMLLIDELINIVDLKSATAIVNVKKDSFFVQGHFPGQPVMPGVLIVEAFGQAAAALTADGIDKSGQAIVKPLELMCPLIKTHYPNANEGMQCANLTDAVRKFYDPLFVGQTKTAKQRCMNAPGHKVNFALLAALTSTELVAMFTTLPIVDCHLPGLLLDSLFSHSQ